MKIAKKRMRKPKSEVKGVRCTRKKPYEALLDDLMQRKARKVAFCEIQRSLRSYGGQ